MIRICPHCNQEFIVKHKSQKYCSAKCRDDCWNSIKKEANKERRPRKPKAIKTCVICNKEFLTAIKTQESCSKECRKLFLKQYKKEYKCLTKIKKDNFKELLKDLYSRR